MRQYSPTQGRFIGRDPFRTFALRPSAWDPYIDGYNVYRAYFAPNGLDPSGMNDEDEEAKACAIATAILAAAVDYAMGVCSCPITMWKCAAALTLVAAAAEDVKEKCPGTLGKVGEKLKDMGEEGKKEWEDKLKNPGYWP